MRAWKARRRCNSVRGIVSLHWNDCTGLMLSHDADEIKEMVDGATNDFLVRADWDVNMRCVDAVNSIKDSTL